MFDDTLIKIVEIKWFIIIDQRVLILPSCYLNKTANGVHHLIIWTNPNVILPDPRFHFKGGFLASNATLPEATWFFPQHTSCISFYVVFSGGRGNNGETTRNCEMTGQKCHMAPHRTPQKIRILPEWWCFFGLHITPFSPVMFRQATLNHPSSFRPKGRFTARPVTKTFMGTWSWQSQQKPRISHRKIYMGGCSPADSKCRPSNGQRLSCAHKTDSVVHTDFLTQMYTQNWLTCAHKLGGWGGAREEKGRIYQLDPLPNFIVGTQPLLDFLRLTITYHHTSTLGGEVVLGKKRVGSISQTHCLTSL